MANGIDERLAGRIGAVTDLLDVRDEGQAKARAIVGAAIIPYSELPARTHELPGKGRAIRVADIGPNARLACEALAARGYPATLESGFEFADSYRIYRLWEPNQFLIRRLEDLEPGKAVDFGCGSGRDSVALAALGWNVLALDALPDAIDKANDLASRHLSGEARFQATVADLERMESWPGGGFDLATMFFYLNRRLLAAAARLLRPNGNLLVETFTEEHRARHGRPNSDRLVLAVGELPTLVPGLEVVETDESWREQSHTARMLARRI